MAGQGFHLNPFEQSTIQALITALGHPGTSGLASVGTSLISGAQDRRATNVATRDQGLQSLQQEAMQLAAQGASQDAIQAAMLGQANDLPLMNGDRGQGMLGDLAGYIGGLYAGGTPTPQGPISGLAPLDVRMQFQAPTEGLSPENQSAIGTIVVQNLQQGVPLVQIRELARQYAIASGASEADVNAAVQLAEQTYGQAAGMDPSTMRSMGDQLRNITAADPSQLTSMFQDNPDLLGAAPYNMPPDQVNITDLIGQMAARPGGLSSLQSVLPQYQQQQSSGGGFPGSGILNNYLHATYPWGQ